MKSLLTVLSLYIALSGSIAQENNLQLPLSINSDGSVAHPSSVLDIKSSDKGVLIPRVTDASDISGPAEGLLVYQSSGVKGFYFYDGAGWKMVGAPSPLVLANLSDAQRDLLTPSPGMLIYNTDIRRPQFYKEDLPQIGTENTTSNFSETGCTSVAQSFQFNTTTSIIDIIAKITFNGAGDVTLNIRDGIGTAGTILGTQTYSFASLPVTNGNEYTFALNSPLSVTCCGDRTFEILQAGNSNMTAIINFNNAVHWDGTGPFPNAHAGKFFKDGVNSDMNSPMFPPLDATNKDLHFTINTQFVGWVTQ